MFGSRLQVALVQSGYRTAYIVQTTRGQIPGPGPLNSIQKHPDPTVSPTSSANANTRDLLRWRGGVLSPKFLDRAPLELIVTGVFNNNFHLIGVVVLLQIVRPF